MSYIIKNPHDHHVDIGKVSIAPKQQLRIDHETPEIREAIDDGRVVISGSGDSTAAERHADVEAFKPFKTGDPAIDGDQK